MLRPERCSYARPSSATSAATWLAAALRAGPTVAAVPSAGTLASKRRVSTRVPPALDERAVVAHHDRAGGGVIAEAGQRAGQRHPGIERRLARVEDDAAGGADDGFLEQVLEQFVGAFDPLQVLDVGDRGRADERGTRVVLSSLEITGTSMVSASPGAAVRAMLAGSGAALVSVSSVGGTFLPPKQAASDSARERRRSGGG